MGCLRLPVTAVLEPQADDFIMLDEVFGPCWAVLKVASVGEGIAKATSMPTGKPLVSYYYGQSKDGSDAWMNGTSSGSLAINSGPMRMQSNFNAAIHGVGNSGLGGASIWGRHVFETFSHTKGASEVLLLFILVSRVTRRRVRQMALGCLGPTSLEIRGIFITEGVRLPPVAVIGVIPRLAFVHSSG